MKHKTIKSYSNNKTFDKKFWHNILFFSLVLLFICSFPYFFTTCHWWVDLTNPEGANIGNTINGIMGPFVAIIASFMTFIAFWVQYKANEQQRQDIAIERFENNFFKLLDIYREIIMNINLENRIKGQTAFHFIFYEFKSILYETQASFRKLEKESSLYISFEIFMSGIVKKGNPVLNTRIVKHLEQKHIDIPLNMKYMLDQLEVRLIINNEKFKKKEGIPTCFRVEKYDPESIFPNLYKGHLEKLTPYFNMVALIGRYLKKNEYLLKETSLQYKDMFLHQLTNHEIALIHIYIAFMKYKSDEKAGDQHGEMLLDSKDMQNMSELIQMYPITFDWRNSNFTNPDN